MSNFFSKIIILFILLIFFEKFPFGIIIAPLVLMMLMKVSEVTHWIIFQLITFSPLLTRNIMHLTPLLCTMVLNRFKFIWFSAITTEIRMNELLWQIQYDRIRSQKFEKPHKHTLENKHTFTFDNTKILKTEKTKSYRIFGNDPFQTKSKFKQWQIAYIGIE